MTITGLYLAASWYGLDTSRRGRDVPALGTRVLGTLLDASTVLWINSASWVTFENVGFWFLGAERTKPLKDGCKPSSKIDTYTASISEPKRLAAVRTLRIKSLGVSCWPCWRLEIRLYSLAKDSTGANVSISQLTAKGHA
jgi:hypothetical protein